MAEHAAHKDDKPAKVTGVSKQTGDKVDQVGRQVDQAEKQGKHRKQ